jgi:predicted ABC-class ATPase
LWRRLYDACKQNGADQSLRQGQAWSGPKGGDLGVAPPTQHVLEQSAVRICEGGAVAVQMTINLPARGRSILGHEAARILETVLGALLQETFFKIDLHALWEHVQSIRDQKYVQDQLTAAGLVAFVRNGAILPRKSGVDDRRMGGCIPFVSPPSLERKFELPNTGQSVTGMGIPTGVTLICGGGFHGKSTLLQTLQLGVYFKVPGDGREFCVTVPSATKIRAEDGRYVHVCTKEN